MIRGIRLLTLCLFLWASLPVLQGQQPVQASVPAGVTPLAQEPDEDTSPVPIDPKTKLPLTPAQIREREIDKYDPMKPLPDSTTPATTLTDRDLPAGTTPADTTNPNGAATPLPGSVAASNAASKSGGSSGPALASDSADSGDYSGPAVLSRSYTLARPMGSQQIKWKLSIGLSFSYDLGQTGAQNPNGTFVSDSTYGESLNWGLSGRHVWKTNQLGVSYMANYSGYSGNGNLSGMNNSLNLDYSRVVSRKLSIQAVESLQLLSQNFSLENPTLAPGSSVANINLATSPNLQILSNTVRQSNTTVSATYTPSSRLSYNLSGSYFVVGRSGQGSIGTFGRQASGDMNYRLTHKTTVGAFYSYTRYLYSHNISSSDSNGIGLIYSYALNQRTQLRTRFGATRIESLAYENIPLPPQLAVILGEAAAISNAHSLRTTSDISVQLVRDFRANRTGSLSYVHGEAPGNGVLLTSTQESISGNFSARIFRRIPVNASAVYSSLQSISQGNIGQYSSETYSASVSREIRKGTTSSFSVNYRSYQISGSPLLQHDIRFTFGLSWSPPENSLRF